MPECAKAHLRQPRVSKKNYGGGKGKGRTGKGEKGLEREEWMREALPQTKIHHYTIGKDNC